MRMHAQQVGHRGRVNNGEHTSLNINFKMEENLFFSPCVNFGLQSCSRKKKEKKQTQTLGVRKKANSLQTEEDFHTNILVSESLKNHGACCQDSVPNMFKEKVLIWKKRAGAIVNGTLKGIPRQFPTPNAA